MRNVLLPVDGSDAALQAALYVIDFIGKFGLVAVHIVNVQPKPQDWQTHGMERSVIDEQLATEAQLSMKAVLGVLNERGIACQSHIKFGDVAEAVVAVAEDLGCDHIVMGMSGRGAISEFLLGSVTHKVLHLAKVPVTCVKNRFPGQ